MKSLIIVLTLFVGLAITVFSAPISLDVPCAPDLAKGLGFCTLLTNLSFGTVALSYCIQGAIANHNNHKAIDHYFSKLRKWEGEKYTMGNRVNRTDIKLAYDESGSESESEYDTDAFVTKV